MLPFSGFQHGFRSARSTADLLIVVSDAIARALTGLGLLELWHFIYPRLLTEFRILGFFTNLSLMQFQAIYLAIRLALSGS